MTKIEIVFNGEWLLTRLGDDVSPPEVVKKYITENYTVKKVLKSDVANLSFAVDGDDLDSQSLTAEIEKLLLETYKDDDFLDRLFALETSSYTEENAFTVLRTNGLKTIKKIDELVGADEFKALANEIVKVAEGIKLHKLHDIFVGRAYVVSVDSGCGLTSCLELFADLANELRLFSSFQKEKVVEIRIPAPVDNEDIANFRPNFRKMLDNCCSGQVICFDISDWLGRLSNPNFYTILDIIRKEENNIFFFRVPYIEANVLKDVEFAINDVLNVKAFTIPPYNSAQIRQLAEKMTAERGYSLEPAAWDTFDTRIALEKNDGKFYGINTIKKVVADMIYLKQISDADKKFSDTVITTEDAAPLINGILPDEKTGLEQLDELVGMEDLKNQILEIIAQIEYSHRDKSVKPPCIHMRFVGNPGTGKTTVARIIGKILKEKGILSKGNFFEVFSRDLCGTHIGETTPKTSAKCRDAYGSVLFIDEAYSLYNDSERDYGREAIDALIAQMENHRSDLVVIMAGYADKMDTLMKLNQGLRSRMPYLITFPNYTREQLTEIFFGMVKGMNYDEAFKTAVTEYFNGLTDETLNSKEFSNARFVRNLYERTWGKAVLRCQLGGDALTLTSEDFIAASLEQDISSEQEKGKTSERKWRRIGF